MTKHPPKHFLTFLHPVYSPKGGIEGAIVTVDGERRQLVVKHAPHLEEALAALREGDVFQAQIALMPPSDKGEFAQPVYGLVDIHPAAGSKAEEGASTSVGKVVRLNYALHGEANGVVLDNGDFVHLTPHGQRQVALAPGDRVEAVGETRALRFGAGRVIDATQINGQELDKPKPKGKHPKPADHKPPKPPKPSAPYAHGAR